MWLKKYPDGGKVEKPKPKFNIKNDPLRPQGLGVQMQDNTRPIPVIDRIKADKEIQNRVALAKINSQPQLKQAVTKNLYEQKLDLAKKEAYATSQPNAKLVNGQLEEINPGYKMEGQPFGPNEKRFEKGLEHIKTGAEVAGMLTGAGELAMGLRGIKPSAEMLYRGIGKAGADDALASGVFRAKQNVEPLIKNGFDFSKQFKGTYYTPKFKTAAQYGEGYVAEVPKDATVFRNRYSKGKNWSQIADENIPIDKGRILKKNWLGNYQEVKQAPKDVWWNGTGYQNVPPSSQEVLSTSSGMDAVNVVKPGYNSHLFNKQAYVPPTTDPSLMAYNSGYNQLSEESLKQIKDLVVQKKPSFIAKQIGNALSPSNIAAIEAGREFIKYFGEDVIKQTPEQKKKIENLMDYISPGMKKDASSILNNNWLNKY